MPSDAESGVSGRCYCGAAGFASDHRPTTVTYCHCEDCRRITGAPVGAFAAFRSADLRFTPGLGKPCCVHPGVNRWFCPTCGSPLAATFGYLPGVVYVPLGVIDQAGDLPPLLHSHMHHGLPWLRIDDDLPRHGGSARDHLNARPPFRN